VKGEVPECFFGRDLKARLSWRQIAAREGSTSQRRHSGQRGAMRIKGLPRSSGITLVNHMHFKVSFREDGHVLDFSSTTPPPCAVERKGKKSFMERVKESQKGKLFRIERERERISRRDGKERGRERERKRERGRERKEERERERERRERER